MSWFSLDLMLPIEYRQFNLSFIRPENPVSHSLGVHQMRRVEASVWPQSGVLPHLNLFNTMQILQKLKILMTLNTFQIYCVDVCNS